MFRKLRCLALVVLVALVLTTGPAFAGGPNIGLVYATAKVKALEEGNDKQSRYREAIEKNGGVVVVLPQPDDPASETVFPENLDGLLLPGGIDVEPRFYGESRHAAQETSDVGLDQFEFKALDFAKENNLPVLGICRGHQVLNVYYGGTLVQDIPTEFDGTPRVVHRHGDPPDHPLDVAPGSLLHEILGVDRLTVNSYHHQAVLKVAPGFVATARTEDGLIEAIERPGDTFLLGVQFHPEKVLDVEPLLNTLFVRFVAEARKVQERRTAEPAVDAQPNMEKRVPKKLCETNRRAKRPRMPKGVCHP